MFEHIIAKSHDSSAFIKNQNSGSINSKPESDFYSMILNHTENSINKEVKPETQKAEEYREESRIRTEDDKQKIDNSRETETASRNDNKSEIENKTAKSNEDNKKEISGKADEPDGSGKAVPAEVKALNEKEDMVPQEEIVKGIREVLKSNPGITALSEEEIAGIIESVITLEKIKGNLNFTESALNDKNLNEKTTLIVPENLKKIPEKMIEEFLLKNKEEGSSRLLKEDDIKKIVSKLVLEAAEGKKEVLSPRERNVLRIANREDVRQDNQIINEDKTRFISLEDETATGKKSFSDKGDNRDGFNFTFHKQDFTGKRVSETPDIKSKTPEFKQNLQEIIDRARITVRDSRNGNFTVKLYPREMGNVNVNLSLDNGTITARFVVDSDDAKNLLSQNLDNLRQQLKDAGIEVGEFFVNVNDHGKRFFQENHQDKKNALLFPEGKEAGMAVMEYDGNTSIVNSSSINVVI